MKIRMYIVHCILQMNNVKSLCNLHPLPSLHTEGPTTFLKLRFLNVVIQISVEQTSV